VIEARRPPVLETGALAWLRRNLFSSFFNGLATLVLLAALVYVLWNLATWMVTAASWQQLWNNLKLFAVYRYPFDLLWRPLSVAAMFMALLGATAGSAREGTGRIVRGVFLQLFALTLVLAVLGLLYWEGVRWGWLAVTLSGVAGYALGLAQPRILTGMLWAWLAALPVAFFLLFGLPGTRSGALRVVPTRDWGGFMLTLILSIVGITVSFPLGVALALGRRSKLPAIKYVCIAFIEVIRGAPLITWLYIASLMVPLLLNIDSDRISALNKALVALTLFSAAYMAENVRGGLQAVAKGQSEAARALGLSAWGSMRLIVLPQALKAVIPAIVGQSIGLFKDTSLVLIVGLQDFFQVHNIVAQQPASLQVQGGVRLELSLFLALVYFYFAFRMSRASRQLEEELGVGTR
jgi:general L-amino acid transport system permease protein